MEKTLLTQTQYAQYRGLTKQRIGQLIKTGHIPASAWKPASKGKLIDVKKADAALDANLSLRGRKGKATKKTTAKDQEIKKQKIRKAGFENLTYSEAQTELMRYKAANEKLDYEERTKELVKASEVKKARFDDGRQVRDAILNIPSRISSMLAAESDDRKVNELLTKELRSALERLSNG